MNLTRGTPPDPHSAKTGILWRCVPPRQLAPPPTATKMATFCRLSACRRGARPRTLSRGAPPEHN